MPVDGSSTAKIHWDLSIVTMPESAGSSETRHWYNHSERKVCPPRTAAVDQQELGVIAVNDCFSALRYSM